MPDCPGLGLPLRHDPQRIYGHYPTGAHGSCCSATSDLISVRELAMMNIMDHLTDKEDWHKKVFDEVIVSKWRDEALAMPDEHFWKLATSDKRQGWDEEGKLALSDDMSDARVLTGVVSVEAFDCCISEFRNKAKYYEETGIIPTLDACDSIAKADHLVSTDLHNALRKAFDMLKMDQASALDWHPNSNDMVQDVVHPSMYPLVYGRTRAFKDENVGVNDAIEIWAGRGDVTPKNGPDPSSGPYYRYQVGFGTVPGYLWSNTYQWLPANVAFQEDGTIKFTSYINNIHPTKFPDIYRTIENLIETALPLWDQCFAVAVSYSHKDGAGRRNVRTPYPDSPGDENNENWTPSDPQEFADVEVNRSEVDSYSEFDDETEEKSDLSRKPIIPEPVFKELDYARVKGKRLANKFQESGLQIIVKMASIELTPEKPEFPAGGWHVEGQVNEHICATALYYLDSEKITSSDLSFRMQTSAYLEDDIQVGQGAYQWLEQIYATNLGRSRSPCLQNYGSVETRQGRLLAFPNVLRFIALWLVDLTLRIIFTANIPPQQMSWWLRSIFGDTPESRSSAMQKLPAEVLALLKERNVRVDCPEEELKLSPEVLDSMRGYSNGEKDGQKEKGELPMTIEEAKEHRVELMSERGAFFK